MKVDKRGHAKCCKSVVATRNENQLLEQVNKRVDFILWQVIVSGCINALIKIDGCIIQRSRVLLYILDAALHVCMYSKNRTIQKNLNRVKLSMPGQPALVHAVINVPFGYAFNQVFILQPI